MTDLYRPKQGLRVPMPGNQPDWPKEGRPVDPLNPYELRLVKDGDLVKIDTKTEPEADGDKPGSTGGKK